MKILFFTYVLQKGGAERVIVDLCSTFARLQYDTAILTCVGLNSDYIIDSRTKRYCLINENKKSNKALRFIAERKIYHKIINDICPDVIITFLPEASFIALSYQKEVNIPIIVSERSNPYRLYSYKPYFKLMKLLYKRCDGFVCQTDGAKSYFSNIHHIMPDQKIKVIPNPVNIPAKYEPFHGIRKKEIVAVGNVKPEKNYKMLLQAFSSLSPDYSCYKLVIYGRDDSKNTLKNMIKIYCLEDNVILKGQVDNVPEQIRSASLYVLPSNSEGMPNALIEAMALGLPVVAADCPCGGPRYLIRHNYNGLLVPNNNESALKSAIEQILSNPKRALEMGNNALEIRKTLDMNKIHSKWVDYIHEITDY